MRTRAWIAAVAGSAAAAAGHALDAVGLLPFVHESAGVRVAMPPVLVVGWLLAAAALAALAASTRPIVIGVPASVMVSAAPELWGRGDVGAVVEPGALLGASLQLLLVLLVVAVAVACERIPAPPPRPRLHVAVASAPASVRSRLVGLLVGNEVQPRAPPLVAM